MAVIGKVLTTLEGPWLDNVQYGELDTVYYKGSSYTVKNKMTPPIGTLPTNTTYFVPTASKGDAGAYNGIATPAGTPSGTRFIGEAWAVNPSDYGSTFVNFGNTLVPVKVGAQYVSNARFIWNGSTWDFFKELVDTPSLTDYATKTDITAKLDKVKGTNLLDPSTFRNGFFYFSGQSGVIQNSSVNNGCGDYIPANPAGLITSGAATTANGLASWAVFNSSKVWLRNIMDSDYCPYVAGDGFCVPIYRTLNDPNFAKNKAVVVGNVYTYEEFTNYKPLLDVKADLALEKVKTTTLQTKVATLENTAVSVDKVSNGTPIVYGNVANFIGTSTSIPQRNIAEDYLVYHKSGLGNDWIITPSFVPTGSNKVIVEFEAEFTKVNTIRGVNFSVYSSPSGSEPKDLIRNIRDNGPYKIEFDPANLTVYQGFTIFYVAINNEVLEASNSVLDLKLTGLKVYEKIDSVKAANFGGDTSKEMFEDIDERLSNVISLASNERIQVSPDGSKFVLSVNNTGNLVALPVIPTKSKYFVNSLGAGFESYGMAASSSDKDFYYLINSYILALKPSYTSSKGGVAPLETLETSATIDTVVANDFAANLVGDEDLIIFQVGDNVNKPERIAVFKFNLVKVLKGIRAKCPNARVIVMGMWYGNAEKYQILQSASSETGCQFISLADIASDPANNSALGMITHLGLAERTLPGVTSVVVNSPTNITVTFTVGTGSYSSTLDVTSHSLASGTLTYTSEYLIISDPGIASHPGDDGQRKIANAVLRLGLGENDQEYYK